jgi:hypothetical protein
MNKITKNTDINWGGIVVTSLNIAFLDTNIYNNKNWGNWLFMNIL